MLVTVHCKFGLGRTHPEPWLDINIIVYTINICISMVNDIVFYIPHKRTASQYIQCKGCGFVQPFVLTKATVSTIMHNIETNTGNHKTKNYAFKDSPESGWCKKYEVDIKKHKS